MRTKRIIVFTLFAVYVLLALDLLFFMRSSMWRYYTYGEYFRENTNFVPFRTVAEFIGYIRDRDEVYGDMALDNLWGNLAVFLPAGVFFPAIWKKQRRFGSFLLTASAVIIGVETIQFAAMFGACDIDDFILNITGALTGFALSRLGIVQRLTYTDAGFTKGERI